MSTPTNEPWTIRRIVRWGAEDFAKRGIESPRLDAELLVAHALGVDRVRLYMDLDRELGADELAAIRALVTRRRKREPIAYLLGEKEFWGRRFVVGPAVLIPRPDTETLVERALAILTGVSRGAVGVDVVREQGEAQPGLESHVEAVVDDVREADDAERPAAPGAPPSVAERASEIAEAAQPGLWVLDLCTGTGAIGLTLACEIAGARVILTDVSAAALEVARRNLAKLAADDPTLPARVELLEGDLFAPLRAGARFALVACNPPYLAAHELAECEPDVRDHEPTIALVSGPSGDELLARVIDGARAWLEPGGTLLVEIGATQGRRATQLFTQAGYAAVCVHRDLAGRDRVVEGRAP